MYVPPHFDESDPAVLHDFMLRHSFALVCSQDAGVPFASHLPLLIDRDPAPHGSLIGHMARANPQWRHAAGQEVLTVFSGPHAYISPTWYAAPDVVPTWNYVAVHAYGRLTLVDEPEELREIVRRTVDVFERPQPRPWNMGGSPGFLDRMLKAIVGFRIEITRLEGKWKLNQNRPAEQRRRVAGELDALGEDNSRDIAELMRRTF